MKKRFIILVVLSLGAGAVACGPLTPSVSKLSSRAADKATPTNGSTTGGNLTITGNLSPGTPRTVPSVKPPAFVPMQRLDDYKRELKNPIRMIIGRHQLNPGRFDYVMKPIAGNEAELVSGAYNVFFIASLKTDDQSIHDLQIDRLKFSLTWIPGIGDDSGAWKLAIDDSDVTLLGSDDATSSMVLDGSKSLAVAKAQQRTKAREQLQRNLDVLFAVFELKK